MFRFVALVLLGVLAVAGSASAHYPLAVVRTQYVQPFVPTVQVLQPVSVAYAAPVALQTAAPVCDSLRADFYTESRSLNLQTSQSYLQQSSAIFDVEARNRGRRRAPPRANVRIRIRSR